MKAHDIIIVGGGHNGLACAAYLARAGRKVLVLERRERVGGAAMSEEVFPGFRFSVFSYVVRLLRPEIIRELDLARHGLEILRPRERRPPRMPNQLPPFLEERIVAFALGQPGLGPRRVAAQLRRPMWGGLVVSGSGVFKVLRRHGISTRRKRLSLVAG